MIENTNFIVSNGITLIHHIKNSVTQITNTLSSYRDYLECVRSLLTSYHSYLSTLNSADGNIYFIVNSNVKTIEFVETAIIKITFTDNSSLQVTFVSETQANHNYLYLTSLCLDVAEYIKDKNKLYVHPDNTQDIPNGIYSSIQTAIDNKTESDIIYLQTGDYTENIDISDSIFINCESDVNITGDIVCTLTVNDQSIRVYGKPNITGHIAKADNMAAGNGTDLFMDLGTWEDAGGVQHCPTATSGSNYRIKAGSITFTDSNGFDTDSYLGSYDIDCLNITFADKVTYMSNTATSHLYFRNFIGVSNLNSSVYLGETSGVYNLNCINCSFNRGHIDFIDNVVNTANLWSSYFRTSSSTFFVNFLNEGNLVLYGINYASKTYDAETTVSGTGSLTIDVALNLT